MDLQISRIKNIITKSCLIVLIICSCKDATRKEYKYLSYVNPLMGTAISTTESARLHSEAGSELRGQTFPAVGVPHGMTHWTPQTQATERKCIPPYYYEDDSIQGFRASHWLSGSCTQDYGSFTIMPITGELVINATDRASRFTHEKEQASPDRYKVMLNDYDIEASVTASSRCGMLRFETKHNEMYVVIEPNSDEGEGYIEIHPETNEIVGFNPAHRIYQGWGEPAGFSGHFVITFDTPFESYGIWKGDSVLHQVKIASGKGQATGAFVKVKLKDNKTLLVKSGTSFSSIEGARKNLQQEMKGWDFEATRNATSEEWEKTLSTFSVKGGSDESKSMYYTALYHSLLVPRVMSDVDGAYPSFAQKGTHQRAEGFNYYDDFSLWDTHRAVHPLLTIAFPEKVSHMVTSLIRKSEQGGWLPIFPCWNNYTAAMIGDHAIAMIGDAILKDVALDDAEAAYGFMRKNAFNVNDDPASYRDGKGRRALASYLKYGYIPLEDSVWDSFHKREQVSRTLEYAYDDFVLGQVAKKLGKIDDYEVLLKRSENYRNVFDVSTGYVRGRFADGTWVKDFAPTQRAPYITEGTPFQYTWFVPHNPSGLMEVMGGKEKFEERLDTLFQRRHYWHGNEPGHHSAYLYSYADVPWKTQHRVHEIIREEYSAAPGGLSGNEDAGQMSAWLVFSMTGFYPVSPGIPYYVLGSPSFEEINFTVADNKHFIIKAKNYSEENIYIQEATLNGNSFNRSYIWHHEIMAGGELMLIMGREPNKQWGVGNAPPTTK